MVSLPRLPVHNEIWQKTLQWEPTPQQQQQFQVLYEAILTGNQRLNLTRITAPEEFWEKHLWDSFYGLLPWLGTGAVEGRLIPPVPASETAHRVIDIGTGGGFPGLPVAIIRPNWQVTLLDSTRKKIAFLDEVSQTLNLHNSHPVADRAESLGHQPTYRASFDIALVRAVGPVSTCLEYSIPLLKQNGIVVLYRGQWTPADQNSLEAATRQLGGQRLWLNPATTPLSGSIRHYCYVQKQAPTPDQFPRQVGFPAKHPLGSPEGTG